jgi:hypothetical protein
MTSASAKDSKQPTAEQRLEALVREGMESPLEPADPDFWNERRQALARAIRRRSKS